jgi:hypothetical protein
MYNFILVSESGVKGKNTLRASQKSRSTYTHPTHPPPIAAAAEFFSFFLEDDEQGDPISLLKIAQPLFVKINAQYYIIV